MEKSNTDYLEAGSPLIIVKKLTYEIIEKAINDYAQDDAYWIKIYGLSTGEGSEMLNQLLDKSYKEDIN